MISQSAIEEREISRTVLRDYCVSQVGTHLSDLPSSQRQSLIQALRCVSGGRQYANPLEEATPPALNKALKQVGVRSLPILTECVASLYPDLLHRISGHMEQCGISNLVSVRSGTSAIAKGSRPAEGKGLWQNLIATGNAVEAEALTAHACIDFIREVGLASARARIPEPTRKDTALSPGIDQVCAKLPVLTGIVRRTPKTRSTGKPEPSRIVMPVQPTEGKPKRPGRTTVTAVPTVTAIPTVPADPSIRPATSTKPELSVASLRAPAPFAPSLRHSRIVVLPIVDRRAKRAARAASTETQLDPPEPLKPALARVRPAIARRQIGDGRDTSLRAEPPAIRADSPTIAPDVLVGPVGTRDQIADPSPFASVARDAHLQISGSSPDFTSLERGISFTPSVGNDVTKPQDPIVHFQGGLSMLKETPSHWAVWDDIRPFLFDLNDAVRNAHAERTRAEHNRRRAPLASEIAAFLSVNGHTLQEWGLSDPVDPLLWAASACNPDDCDATIALLGELRTAIKRLQELEASHPRRLIQRDQYRTELATVETRVAELVRFLGEGLDPLKADVPGQPMTIDDPTDFRTYLANLDKQADARVSKARVGTLLTHSLFSEAVLSIREVGDNLLSVRTMAEAMAHRLNFDIDGAINCLDRLIIGRGSELALELRNELREMRPRNQVGEIVTTEDQERLLPEVYWQADLARRQGRMIDFVARIGGLVEQALLAENGRTFGRIFKSLDEYRNFVKHSSDASALSSVDPSTPCGDLYAHLEIRSKRQRALGNVAEADRLMRIHVYATRLEWVKHLRNRSCVAHGLERVTNSAIDAALNEKVVAVWRLDEARGREVINTIPLRLFGSERVCWVAHEILRDIGISLPDRNPLVVWGERLAGLMEEDD